MRTGRCDRERCPVVPSHEKIEGRRLKFTVSATDSGGLVGAGKITRVLVDFDRFMSKCCDA